MIAGFALFVLAVLGLFFRRFVLVFFDPLGREAAGFPAVAFQTLFLALIAAPSWFPSAQLGSYWLWRF